MFKNTINFERANFTKLYQRKTQLIVSDNRIYTKKKFIWQKKLALKTIYLVLKKLKKRKFPIFLTLRLNLLKSFKSKNSRMGNGKGILRKQLITSHNITLFRFKKVSSSRKNKLLIFLTKQCFV